MEKDSGEVLRERKEIISFLSNLLCSYPFPRSSVERVRVESYLDREELEAPFTLKEICKVVFGFDRFVS